MAFLDNFTKKVSDASAVAVQKTKDLAEIAKQNSMIGDEEKKITQTYEKIGKAFVEKFADSADEEMAAMIAEITASKEKIDECKKKIQTIKGVSVCPNCGAEVAAGAAFCPGCGNKIEIPVVEEAAPAGVTCSECGAVVPEGTKFCTSCGKPIVAPVVEEAVAEVVEAVEEATQE